MTAKLETTYRPLLEAVAYAARAHRGHTRKDNQTPYVSHVFRVCLVVRDVFGISDPTTLTAALLHDTIEDTLTDFDELEEHFGREVAGWVALLSKDKRRPEKEREEAYLEQLAGGPWQVHACKLADIFDNLMDRAHLKDAGKTRAITRAEHFLDFIKDKVGPEIQKPYALVRQLLDEIKASA